MQRARHFLPQMSLLRSLQPHVRLDVTTFRMQLLVKGEERRASWDNNSHYRDDEHRQRKMSVSNATVHRPSDLRRSVSVSVGPVPEGDESADNSPPGLSYSASGASMASHPQHRDMMEMSRHGTPLSTVDGSPALNPMNLQQDYSQVPTEEYTADGSLKGHQRTISGANGVSRRARSATVMELGPYPHKSHSCPIPTCGRLFKRLEHLKR